MKGKKHPCCTTLCAFRCIIKVFFIFEWEIISFSKTFSLFKYFYFTGVSSVTITNGFTGHDDQIQVLRICVMNIESGKNWANLVTSLSTLAKLHSRSNLVHIVLISDCREDGGLRSSQLVFSMVAWCWPGPQVWQFWIPWKGRPSYWGRCTPFFFSFSEIVII